jgi:hypothetical protein
MSLKRRLLAGIGRSASPADHPSSDNTESDPDTEGHLDLNTAALMEGAPPAGAGGRIQPAGGSPDPRPPRGPGEGEVQNLPG